MSNFNIQIYLKKLYEIMQTEFIGFPSWLKVFYNEDGTFKSIAEILDLISLYHIEEDVLNTFLSSEDFLNSIDLPSLTTEQKNIIINSLQVSYDLEIQRYKNNFRFLKRGFITSKMVIAANSMISKRLVYYGKKIEELKNINIDDNKDDLKRQR